MKRRILLFLTMLSLVGCQLDELHDDSRPPDQKAFSVEEAMPEHVRQSPLCHFSAILAYEGTENHIRCNFYDTSVQVFG